MACGLTTPEIIFGGMIGLMTGLCRKPEHDKGSVEKEVEEYLKRRRLIRSGALGVGGDPLKSVKNPSSARSGVGAR